MKRFALSTLILLAVMTTGGVLVQNGDVLTKAKRDAMTPGQVLKALKDGNARFLRGEGIQWAYTEQQRLTAKGQYPMAVILGCIDSRAPAEIVFDRGIGDLFNARIAGNFANTDIVASMEYSCKVAGAKLVVVMGHTDCGAIKSACDDVKVGNITKLLAKIKPAANAVHGIPEPHDSSNKAFVQAVAAENVQLTIQKIRDTSPILASLETGGKIRIVGCMYDLSSGKVSFQTKAVTSR